MSTFYKKNSHDFLSPSPSPSPSPNYGLQSESESDEMAGSEKLCKLCQIVHKTQIQKMEVSVEMRRE
jgi:hypothetical protein